MTFGEKFKKRRLEMGYTQEQFAIEFNKRYNYSFNKSTISMWENGKNFPTVAMLKRISEFFNVTTDYLLCKNKQNIDDTQLDQLIFEEIKKLSIKSKEKAFEYIKLLKISEFINLDLIKE